jgi:hypothetical protein
MAELTGWRAEDGQRRCSHAVRPGNVGPLVRCPGPAVVSVIHQGKIDRRRYYCTGHCPEKNDSAPS